MNKTKTFRIPIVQTPDGKMATCAFSDFGDEQNLQDSSIGIAAAHARVYWVEVEVPEYAQPVIKGKLDE